MDVYFGLDKEALEELNYKFKGKPIRFCPGKAILLPNELEAIIQNGHPVKACHVDYLGVARHTKKSLE